MGSYKTEATTQPLGQLDSSHHLIESDRVEGTAVIDRNGVKLGTIERLMIDKLAGQVRYAVLASGGFLGTGESYHPLPWEVLNYNSEEGAYVVDLDRERLERAPHYLGRDEPDWSNHDYNVRIFEYYRIDVPARRSSRV